jgi:hypothetical protein
MSEYLVIDLPASILYVDATTKERLAEYDKHTRYASTDAEGSLGRLTQSAAQTVIAALLEDEVFTPTTDGYRGIGPVIDKQGNSYRIVLPQCDVLKNETTVDGWAYELNWCATHNSGAGVVYQHGPFTKNWMATITGVYPEYDPADEGETGVPADGRLPFDNSLPPTDSADETEATTVNFYGSVWTRGAAVGSDFKVLRDGVPFLDQVCVGFLTYDTGSGLALYWVDSDDDWFQFSPGNARLYLGNGADPRIPIIPGDPGDFFDWEATGVSATASSNILTGISTPEYNTLEVGMPLIFIKDESLVRGSTTRGPGGMFPNLFAANPSSLGSGSAGQVKYVLAGGSFGGYNYNAGDVAQCEGGTTWYRKLDNPAGRIDRYIYGKTLPRSLHLRVKTLLGGGSIEFEGEGAAALTSQQTTTGTLVVNNIPLIQAAIDGLTGGTPGFQLPDVLLPGAGVLYIDREDFELTAVSEDAGIWTPRGCAYAGVQWGVGVTGGRLSSMTFKGNYLDNDHGMNWEEGPSTGLWVSGSPSPVTDFSIPQQFYHGSCAVFQQSASGAVVSNVWFHDYPQALSSLFCDDNWYQGIHARGTAPQMDYTAWLVSHGDCVGGGCEDGDFVFTYSTKAAEAFKSRTCTYRRNNFTNGALANNNSQVLYEDNSFLWTADSHVAESYQSPSDFTVQISKNIGGGYADLGVVVRNNYIEVEDYTYKGVCTRGGIEVNTDTFAVRPRFENVTHVCVDYHSGVTSATVDSGTSELTYKSGAIALDVKKSDLVGTFTCTGLSPHHSNWGGAWNQAAFRATHGSARLSGQTFVTSCDGHGHGDPGDWEVW